MATCTAWKIIFNNCILPEIYFSYDVAKAQLRKLEETNCASFGRIVLYDNETDNFNFEPFTVRVCFEWLEGNNETMDDSDDTAIGIAAANDDVTFAINADISFEQIIDAN